MIGEAPRSQITGVPGWESADEQALLVELAQVVPADGVIVEIGSEFGMSASLFCHGADSAVKIYSVDLFPDNMLQEHQSNLREAGFDGRCLQIGMYSAELGQEWKLPDKMVLGGDWIYPHPGHDIDLLFIDGDHSYEGVKADIEAWLPHIKRGGHVAFHDCACVTNKQPHFLHYEVTRAVNEWYWNSVGWQLMQMIDTITVFRKV